MEMVLGSRLETSQSVRGSKLLRHERHATERPTLARIIHERFYCNRGFAAATHLAADFTASKRAGSPLGRLTSCSRMPPFLAGSALEPASPTLTRGPAPL